MILKKHSPSGTGHCHQGFDSFFFSRQVLVHCHQGVSRSCSYCIAYKILRESASFDEANRDLKAKRGICNPNLGFCTQLIEWSKRVASLPGNTPQRCVCVRACMWCVYVCVCVCIEPVWCVCVCVCVYIYRALILLHRALLLLHLRRCGAVTRLIADMLY